MCLRDPEAVQDWAKAGTWLLECGTTELDLSAVFLQDAGSKLSMLMCGVHFSKFTHKVAGR